MKKFYLLILTVLLLIIITSYFVLNNDCLSNNISKIIAIINVSQIFISVYIAYLLYDRFGTSKKILDKQNEKVIEYLEELKNIKFYLYIFNDKNLTISPIYPRKDMSYFSKKEKSHNEIYSCDFSFVEMTIK